MKTHTNKSQGNKSRSAARHVSERRNAGNSAFQFVDRRPEALAQRKLQELADQDPRAGQIAQAQAAADRRSAIVQRVKKKDPAGKEIEVEELMAGTDPYLPNCVDDPLNPVPDRKGYRRSAGITSGWNDTDLFYADGTGPLVQITVKTVNDYWDPKYEGFNKLSGPDWTKNCEDYATGYAGKGESKGNYTSTSALGPLIQDVGRYVLKMSYHWMSVERVDENHITIRQKDGESAVYCKSFTLAAGLEYILGKVSSGGTVFKATS